MSNAKVNTCTNNGIFMSLTSHYWLILLKQPEHILKHVMYSKCSDSKDHD